MMRLKLTIGLLAENNQITFVSNNILMMMLQTCIFMKPYKIFSYMHKSTINRVVQKFGLLIKFGTFTVIFSIQFLY